MTIDDIILTAEETITLESLKEDYNLRYDRSPAKKSFRAREIKDYSLIFDEDNLALPEELSDDDKPFKKILMPARISQKIENDQSSLFIIDLVD